jgi:hypothetical protein
VGFNLCPETQKVFGVSDQRIKVLATTDVTMYDLFLRARAESMSWEKTRILRALNLVGHALEFDPYYGPALALAAQCRQNLHVNGWNEHLEGERQQSVELARRAIRASSDDPYVLSEAGFVIGYFEHEIDPAVVLIDRSLELDLSFPPLAGTGADGSGSGQDKSTSASGTSRNPRVSIRCDRPHPHSGSRSVTSSRAASKVRW